MSRSIVQRRHLRYETSQKNTQEHRKALRQAVLEWKEQGATIVEIADTLGWSRQSVYDLIGGGRG